MDKAEARDREDDFVYPYNLGSAYVSNVTCLPACHLFLPAIRTLRVPAIAVQVVRRHVPVDASVLALP